MLTPRILNVLTRNPRSDIKNGKGPIDALFINDIPKPEIKPTEALVKVKAFGINRMDLFQREGNYPVPAGASRILGVEFSGIIDSVGPDAGDGFKIGDEVFGLTYGGELLRSLVAIVERPG